MKIEMRRTEAITPYEKNPRLNDQAVSAVAASIREFGFRQPIVVDGEGVIISGHTRWKAAQSLDLAKVPVIVASDLAPEKVQAYRIADNQTASLAEWDFDLLPDELRALQALDVDLAVLGFSEEELDTLLSIPLGTDGKTPGESIDGGIAVCRCPTCGHEHATQGLQQSQSKPAKASAKRKAKKASPKRKAGG